MGKRDEILGLRAEIDALKASQAAELAAAVREAETAAFLKGKAFVNRETGAYFEAALRAAVDDEANAGRDVAELFEALVVGEDGAPRRDVLADSAARVVIPPSGGTVCESARGRVAGHF